jgi:hypothetical protein
MLGIFSSKAAHPLLDAREAKRVFAELVAHEAIDGVKEATAWLESLPAAEGFKLVQRLEAVLHIDEAVLRHTQRIAQDYLRHVQTGWAGDARLWEINHDYWQQLANAYRNGLELWRSAAREERATLTSLLPLILPRTLYALGMSLKWGQFRYGPISADFWRDLGATYLMAVEIGADKTLLSLHPATMTRKSATSSEAEYLKVLVFHASAPDQLTPPQIEVAARLIEYFLPQLTLLREVWPTSMYWVDASKPLPPMRLGRLPEVTPGLRFFTCTRAAGAVETMLAGIRAGQGVPPELDLGAAADPATVLPVLEHLAAYWAPMPPIRAHARHRAATRLAVVHGFDATHARLSGKVDAGETESWVADDISLGGMGALAPVARSGWIHIGALLGIQPEGGENWLVGVVRRYACVTPDRANVGIETLAKRPRALFADAGGLATACLLLDVPVVGEHVRLALPRTAAGEHVALTFALDGAHARLFPVALLETGADFVIARFLVQSFN